MTNGYVLATQAPNSVPLQVMHNGQHNNTTTFYLTTPLQVYYKRYSASHQDYATVASPTAINYYTGQGYTLVQPVSGYVFLSAPTVGTSLSAAPSEVS